MKISILIKNVLSSMTMVILLLSLHSCEKENDLKVRISGDWKLISIDNTPAGEELEVRISFSHDGFSIYQRAEAEVFYTYYCGAWSMEDSKISGTYSDGSEWGNSYSVDISSNDILTLTTTSAPYEVTCYTREELPSSIEDNIKHIPSRLSE